MDTPTYTATITIGGTSQTTEFTAFPSPREGKYLVTRQSGKLILTCIDANGDPYDLSSITPACAVIPWNSSTSATSLGSGSISGVDNNIYTISWVRDTIPASYSTYAQDRSGAIVLRVEFQESGTDDFFSCYTRFNVVDGDFAGDMQTLPLDLISFTNYLDYSELTIDTGAITVTQEFQTVDTEGDASSDDLDTITPADARQLLYLKLADASRIVTLKHGTGNLYLPDNADLVMKSNQVYIFTYSDALSGWNLTATVVDASSTTFTPAGNLASTNVQDALEELDNEKQPLDAGLTSISGLTTVADRMIYTTASDTYAVTTLTSAGRALIDDADATAQRSTLGLGSIATQNSSGVSITGGSVIGLTNLGTATYTELTISSGVATATQFNHTIDTEGDASSDDLDTLTVGISNFILLKLADASRIVTLKDGTGNLDLGYDIIMTFDTCYLLSYNGASWNIINSTQDTSIHTDISGEINGLTEKSTPITADYVLGEDSANSFSKVKIPVGRLFNSVGDVIYTFATPSSDYLPCKGEIKLQSSESALYAVIGLKGNNKVLQFSTRTSAADNQWLSVCWSPELSLFCAVSITGTGNRVMTSPDGVTWTSRTSAVDNQWFSVCWSPELSLFCAVSNTGTGDRVMTSPDGTTWTSRTSASDNDWVSVCWSPELTLFCAVASTGTGNRVMTSPDGSTWTSRTSSADNDWRSVCWSPELTLFCAVSITGTGTRVMTSPDGSTWTTRTSAADNSWYGVCWSPELSMFCAVSSNGTNNQIMTSKNGINWTSRSTPANNTWRSICWSPELSIFLAVSSNGTGTRVMTSTNGFNWSIHNNSVDNGWYSVCWSPENMIFASVSNTGTGDRVMTSSFNFDTSTEFALPMLEDIGGAKAYIRRV